MPPAPLSPRPAPRHRVRASILFALVLLSALCLSQALLPPRGVEASRPNAAAAPGGAERLSADYGELPLRFEANRGQTSGEVKFLARGSGYTLFLTPAGAVLRLRLPAAPDGLESDAPDAAAGAHAWATLRLSLEGARRAPALTGLEELPGKSNYLVGGDARRWRTGVSAFARVRYASVYPGVDMIYYGREGRLEYDFVVAPGADPARIRLRLDGARATRVEEGGDLVIATDAGDVRQQKPFAYQEVGGARREVSARYVKDARGAVRFALGSYDRALPLVIDPVLVYSSYLGGLDSDQGLAVAVDAAGSAYLSGSTLSTDFPGPSPLQVTKGAFTDAFVLKLSPDGKSVAYATYLGGNGDDRGQGIAVDAAGNAYVVGLTGSGSFPATLGAFQTAKDGSLDAFLAKLNPTGSALVYATYLGGNGSDQAFAVAADAQGSAYVVGRTDSVNFTRFPVEMRAGHPAFRSADGGANWAPSSNGLTASAVVDFANAPGSPETAYAATSLGVFKTADGGASWQLTGQSRPSTAPPAARAVVVDPTNPSVVYAGTVGNGGLYKSTNGGALYEVKNSGLNSFVQALAIDPSTPSTVYAGTVLGIFKTINGGETWVAANGGLTGASPNVVRIVVDPSNPQNVYVGTSNRGVLKSTNGGANWSPANNGFPAGLPPPIRALAINPAQPSTLYAAGNSPAHDVFKSTDGGASWANSSNGLLANLDGQTFTPSVNALLVDPSAPSVVYAASALGGVFKSTDGGANWSPSSGGVTNRSLTALAAVGGSPAGLLLGTNVGGDAYAAKFNAAGSQLAYLRLLGGVENEDARGVAVGPDGSAYVTGSTFSPDFPTLGAFQNAPQGGTDAFVTKLGPNGATAYSTYLGGTLTDTGVGVAVGPGGAAYVTGATASSDFPVANPLRNPAGGQFFNDAFVTKLAADGQSLVYSTYLGGNFTDQSFGIAVGPDGAAAVTGVTSSTDFPVEGSEAELSGLSDAFVTRLNPEGSALLFSTYFGGDGNEQGNGVAVDAAGGIYVVGNTSSLNLPLANAVRGTFGGGGGDGFVAKFGVQADLSISINESGDPVMVNNPLSYTVGLSNSGPSPATAVTLVDTLPAGLSLVSATPSQGSCSASGQVVTCQLGDLAPGAGASVSLHVSPTAAGTVTNSATVTAAEHDIDASNNGASVTTKISASPTISGRVTLPQGGGLPGVTVTLGGAQTAAVQTDAGGRYQFAELPAGGAYTVTPSLDGVSFEPPSRAFNNLNADQTADFVGTPCAWSLSAPNLSIGAGGGAGAVTVNTLRGCPWTAVSHSDWITITSGASGTQTGAVEFSVAPTSAPRVGRLTVAGRHFAVYQEAGSCAAPSFAASSYNLSSSSPSIAEAADLNGDGHADVVILTDAVTGFDIQGSVMLNDGAGSFTTSTFLTGLGGPRGLTLGDFNGDARPDLVVWGSVVRILLNNGSGGFGQSAVSVNLDSAPDPNRGAVIAAEVNNDGKADLLVYTSGGVRVLLGDGHGGFVPAATVPTTVGNSGFRLRAAFDVNADANVDLILSSGNTSQMSVRLGDGAGGFGPHIFSPTLTFAVPHLAPGDFDGDGTTDILLNAIVCDALNTSCSVSLAVMAGDGAGHFTLKTRLDHTNATHFAVADFNRDAKLDAAVTKGSHELTILSGDGEGGFALTTQAAIGSGEQFSGVNSAAAADFDKDGRVDLAVAVPRVGASVLANRCAASPSISGRVTAQTGLAGVTINVTGAQAATAQTDAGGNYFVGGLAAGGNYVVTPSKENYRFSPASISVNGLTGNRAADFTATPMTVRLAQAHFLAEEGGANFRVDVLRGGDTSGAATVGYTTVNGTASDRSDYTAAVGTLRFAPGETVQSFTVHLSDDRHVEGFESLTLSLRDPSGAILGGPASALVEIRDNDFAPSTANPVDGSSFFVRQHYLDFLNREPDAEGLAHWTNEIEQCGADQQCREVRRVNVSAAFFLSIEFQETGYLAYRAYKAAYGDATPPGAQGPVPSIRIGEFLADAQAIGRGVRVGVGAWFQQLEMNKADYVREFVGRARFLEAFPATMTPSQFVDKLNANAGGVLSTAERDQLVAELSAAADPAGGRAAALRRVAEDADLRQRETNRAFVLMQYFGYLRRDPDAVGFDGKSDPAFAGYFFWLDKLEDFNGNFVDAEMVRAFIESIEYRQRFGQ